MHEPNVPDDGVVILPSGMRSGMTSSRKRALHVAGSEQSASARMLSVRISSTLGRGPALSSGGSGAGVRSEIPLRERPRPVIPTRAACTNPWAKQSSGVAACRKRLSTMSIHMQDTAPTNANPTMTGGGPLTAGTTRRTSTARMPIVMTTPPTIIATSASELPHAANQPPTVPRSAKPSRTVSRPM